VVRQRKRPVWHVPLEPNVYQVPVVLTEHVSNLIRTIAELTDTEFRNSKKEHPDIYRGVLFLWK
jgi:hypothetical protein